MSKIINPEERANRIMWFFEPDKDFDTAKKNAIAMCEEMISEDPNHYKGGERYYYEVYYHLIKYPKIKEQL